MDRDELYDASGVFIGVLAIIILIIVISYCHRRQALVNRSDHDESSATTEQGLEEATICAYPKLLYSEAELHMFNSISCTSPSCCSICLADFEDKDVLRSVPNCGHFFHQMCVDKWLLLHPTCPVCRNSLVDPSTYIGSVADV